MSPHLVVALTNGTQDWTTVVARAEAHGRLDVRRYALGPQERRVVSLTGFAEWAVAWGTHVDVLTAGGRYELTH